MAALPPLTEPSPPIQPEETPPPAKPRLSLFKLRG
jgi:hypothetical protein